MTRVFRLVEDALSDPPPSADISRSRELSEPARLPLRTWLVGTNVFQFPWFNLFD